MTLTLPGFAGLILTIGVAADANVVVFERIKEEVRGGRSVRAAIATGYAKGFHTILDANVVTAITALVLFLIAVASVKGFALMLLLGTLISLLTAVAATRAILGLLGGFKWFNNPRFMGAKGEAIRDVAKIDVASRRRRWILLSVATMMIVASVLARPQGPQLRHRLQGRHADVVRTHNAYDGRLDRTIAREGRLRGCGRAGPRRRTTGRRRTRVPDPHEAR